MNPRFEDNIFLAFRGVGLVVVQTEVSVHSHVLACRNRGEPSGLFRRLAK